MKKSSAAVMNKKSVTQGRWILHPMAKRAVAQQALPKRLPIPPREAKRVEKGSVSLGEFSRWITHYLQENPESEHRDSFQEVASRFERFQHGSELVQEGRLAEAHAIFRDIVAKNANDARAQLNLAALEIDLGHAQEALQILEGIQGLVGDEPRYPVLMARSLGALNRREEMVQFLWEAQKRAPQNTALISELQRIGELVPVQLNPRDLKQCRFMPRRQYIEQTRGQVFKLVAAGNVKQALEAGHFHLADRKPELAEYTAERIIEREAGNAEAWMIKGLAEMSLGKATDAEASLRKSVELDASKTAAHPGLAQLLVQTGRGEEAKALLEKALEIDPNTIQAAELLILFDQTPEERKSHAEALKQKFPSSWVPMKVLGDLLFNEGNFAVALELHKKAFELGDSDDALTMILHEMGKLGQIEQSVDLIEKTPRLMKRSAQVRWNSANLLLEAGRLRPAVQVLEAMLKDNTLPYETRFSVNSLLSQVLTSVKGRV